MKRVLLVCSITVLLCACEPANDGSGISQTEPSSVSECTTSACAHVYGSEPIDTVGNIDFYECQKCGERKIIANGSAMGGE